MNQGGVWRFGDDPKTCRTIACHAGWYMYDAFVQGRFEGRFEGRMLYRDAELSEDKGCAVLYQHGAELMARDLGFSSRAELIGWACVNSQIWGNPCGGRMFDMMEAFNWAPLELHRLERIARHWDGVAQRREELVQDGH